MGWSLTPAMWAWHLETGINTFSASLADTAAAMAALTKFFEEDILAL